MQKLFDLLLAGRSAGVELEVVLDVGGEPVLRLAGGQVSGSGPVQGSGLNHNFNEAYRYQAPALPPVEAIDMMSEGGDPDVLAGQLRKVRGRLHKGRPTGRGLDIRSAVEQNVITMRRAGKSIPSIAGALRVSVSTVRRVLEAAGLTNKRA